uniref:CHH1 n=1 Tax=Crangon crangon TaxID=491138 RepID=A0A218L0H7_CRACN|nr:CHH1 precursor [Crangon crangon]
MSTLMWSLMFMILMVFGAHHRATARSAEGLTRIQKLLSSSSSSSGGSSGGSVALQPSSPLHSLPKRAVADPTCRGIYDRELFEKLDRVCDDCYNLYRKAYVDVNCRSNCYGNYVFRQCLNDLLMSESLKEYVTAVQMVGK